MAISRREAREILRRVGSQPDEGINLAEAALALGALDPSGVVVDGDSLDQYLAHLNQMTADLAALVDPGQDSLPARIGWLREVMVVRHGYSGDHDTYDDLQNANMLRVIDRRRGLPVALGILFMQLARSQGWAIQGLNFPGHFLLRLDVGGARSIIDPFNEGQPRSVVDLRDLLKATAGSAAELSPDHYQTVASRDVLLRLQNNLKLRYLSGQDMARAFDVLETMRLVAPREPALWRETGLLHAHAGRISDAIDALHSFMELTDSDQHRHQTASLIQQLKNRLN